MSISPARVVFRNIKKSEKGTAEVSITVNDPDKIKIASVRIKNPRFEVKQKEGTPAKGGLYEVVFKGTDKLGAVSAGLIVELEGSSKPFIELPVSTFVSGNLSFPSRIFFFRTEDGYPSKNFSVFTKNGDPVSVSKIEDLDKLLTLEITKNNTPRINIKATVADQKKMHDQSFSHKLILHTDDKDQPTIEIKYRIKNRGLRSISRAIPNPNTKGNPAPVVPKKASTPKK